MSSFIITDDGMFIARAIREARELRVIQGSDFASFMADKYELIGPARKQFLNIADPKAGKALEEEVHDDRNERRIVWLEQRMESRP